MTTFEEVLKRFELAETPLQCEGCGKGRVFVRHVFNQWLCTRCMAQVENGVRL